MENKFNELKELCKPLVEFLNKNCDPHTKVEVSMDFIKVVSEKLSIPNMYSRGYLKGEFTQIVVETDENNPITIAEIKDNDIDFANGYRVRLTPTHN